VLHNKQITVLLNAPLLHNRATESAVQKDITRELPCKVLKEELLDANG
jgi:hypothetical protein